MQTADVEKKLISAFVKDKQFLAAARAIKFDSKYFDTYNAKTIYSLLEEYCADGDDALGFDALRLVVDYKQSLGIYVDTDELKKFIDEAEATPQGDSVLFTIQWLRNYSRQRSLAKALDESYQILRGKGDIAGATNLLTNAIFTDGHEIVEPEDLEAGFQDRWDRRLDRLNNKTYQVVPTGFPSIDVGMEGGMRTNETWYVAGAPGIGKSRLLDTIGVNAFEAGFDVLKVTTENTLEQSLGRTESLLWSLNYRQLQNCDPAIAPGLIASQPKRPNRHFTIRIFPNEDTASDLIQKIGYLKIQYGFDPVLLLIDSPDFLAHPTTSLRGLQEKTHDVRTRTILILKKFIEREHKIQVASSHTKLGDFKGRRGYRDDRLDLGDLSDTSGKVRLADGVITLNQNAEQVDEGSMTAYMAKNRDNDKRPFEVRLKGAFGSPRLVEDLMGGGGGDAYEAVKF